MILKTHTIPTLKMLRTTPQIFKLNTVIFLKLVCVFINLVVHFLLEIYKEQRVQHQKCIAKETVL